MRNQIESWLDQFEIDHPLRGHVVEVIFSLPGPVRDDLMGDESFVLCAFDARADGQAIRVRLQAGRPGRCVALKTALGARSDGFARYVIAHELAHAHLRNRGRWPDDDPEQAADALAADWGFPRPAKWG